METKNTTQGFWNIHMILKYTYGVVPIVAGVDKFTGLLADWPAYIHPGLRSALPINGHAFMMAVGIIEIIAGILVFTRPKLGATIVSAWLATIGASLIFSGTYVDVAVRDIVMSVGAFVLAKMTSLLEQGTYAVHVITSEK